MNGFLSVSIAFAFIWPYSFSTRDGNSRFKLCCARQQSADQTCKKRFCDFSVLAQDNIFLFLNLCSPKGNTVKNMWECATSKSNHTECCKKRNVPRDCLKYCDYEKAPPPNDYLKHLLCLQSFDKIRDCFREYLNQNKNIFGDF